MHTISPRRARDIRSIVNQQTRLAPTRKLRRTRNKLKQRARRQRLLANLKKGDFGVYSSANQPEDIVRSCLTARYRIDDRKWQLQRHDRSKSFWGSSRFARQ